MIWKQYMSDLRSSGILRSVKWQFCADVSGQPIGSIFKGQEVQEESRYRINILRCVIPQKSADLTYIAAEA
jgi:hypothetical protein